VIMFVSGLQFRIIPCILLIYIACTVSVCHGAEPGTWGHFQEHFITSDGRVIDYIQKKISHSEGQGYAMLLAVKADDQKTFSRLWTWTQNNLQVRYGDALMCWSWGKRPTGEWAILDHNNASDGDICIAYALILASEKWQNTKFKKEALRIIDSIRSKLIVNHNGTSVVLPGYYGFIRGDGLILNPAYWVLPAFTSFAKHQDFSLWQKVHDDSVTMICENVFSDLKLPPDWLFFNKDNGSIFAEKSTLCGYEAIRVFLFLAWDNKLKELPGIVPLLDRIDEIGFVPMPFDLARNNMSIWGSPAGFYAVMARCADSLGRNKGAKWLWKEARERLKNEPKNYYSHVLYLLARLEVSP